MSFSIKRFLSHDCSPFEQFIKYGTIGVMATCVQMLFFYLLAATCIECLKADDVAVRYLSLPSANVDDQTRAIRFAIDTGIGFIFANIFCWVMNRLFVFRPGKYRWWTELTMFFGASGFAVFIATLISWFLIHQMGLMTSAAALIEVFVSFVINYTIRKFFIFKG